jgi:hypothetical protein
MSPETYRDGLLVSGGGKGAGGDGAGRTATGRLERKVGIGASTEPLPNACLPTIGRQRRRTVLTLIIPVAARSNCQINGQLTHLVLSLSDASPDSRDTAQGKCFAPHRDLLSAKLTAMSEQSIDSYCMNNLQAKSICSSAN